MKVVGTLVVRDAEDVIGAWLDHHLASGVDEVVATDHLSRDGTAAALAGRRGVVKVTRETDPAFRPDVWATRMVAEAAARGADWVVHIESDEFWHGIPTLAALPESVGVAYTEDWFNHVPPRDEPHGGFRRGDMPLYTTGSGWSADVAALRWDALCSTARKVAHRPAAGARVGFGNHDVAGVPGGRLVCAGLTVHHYPVRSRAQFARKVATGAESLALAGYDAATGRHWSGWYEHYRRGRLDEVYAEMRRGALPRLAHSLL